LEKSTTKPFPLKKTRQQSGGKQSRRQNVEVEEVLEGLDLIFPLRIRTVTEKPIKAETSCAPRSAGGVSMKSRNADKRGQRGGVRE